MRMNIIVIERSNRLPKYAAAPDVGIARTIEEKNLSVKTI